MPHRSGVTHHFKKIPRRPWDRGALEAIVCASILLQAQLKVEVILFLFCHHFLNLSRSYALEIFIFMR